jgi:HPr kinase/phosphorylase
MPAEEWVHATAIAIDGQGVLFRGPSGSGKSRLACDMLYHASAAGRQALLVGDDRLLLMKRSGGLFARGHEAITGKLEVRGLGFLDFPHVGEAKLRWVIELTGSGERLPERSSKPALLLGQEFPTYSVSSGAVTATALLMLLFGGAALTHQDES